MSPDDPPQSFTIENFLIFSVRNNQFRTIYLARGNSKDYIINNLKPKYKDLVCVYNIDKYKKEIPEKFEKPQ